MALLQGNYLESVRIWINATTSLIVDFGVGRGIWKVWPQYTFLQEAQLTLVSLLCLQEQARYLCTHHGSVPFACLLHLRMHIRCWVELILWGNDAAERSIAGKNYSGIQSGSRCSPDIAYYDSHLHPSPLIQIQNQVLIRPQCLNSLPELQL